MSDESREATAEQFRDAIEGLWVGMPIEFEGTGPFSFANGGDDELEDLEAYIVQDEEIPSRFLAQYRNGVAEGEMDLRVTPGVFEFDGSMSVMFTFLEDDEIEEVSGGGFASCPEDGLLLGMMMIHMGGDRPFCWKRMSKDIPSELREMILEGVWSHEDEEDEEYDGPVIVLEGLNDFLGGLLTEEDDDDEEEELDLEELLEKALAKSLEEFLLFQDGLLESLEKGGITTVQELLDAEDEELLAIKGIGPRRLQEIHQVIHAWGLDQAWEEGEEDEEDEDEDE